MSVILGKPEVPQHWLLDANVLFSEWTRWLMVALAQRHKAKLYWTPHIENECYRNLVRLGRLYPDDAEQERSTLPSRLGAVLLPQQHEPYLADVRQVDEKDRHVAAAALALKHQIQAPVGLVTWNLRDFPRKPLLKMGLLRICPDELCTELIRDPVELHNFLKYSVALMEQGLAASNRARSSAFQAKSQPLPQDTTQWLAYLARNKMHKTARVFNRIK